MIDVLIIGGGLTGLFAAATFDLNGFETFELVEARPDFGGRTQQTSEFGLPLDLGAVSPFKVCDGDDLEEIIRRYDCDFIRRYDYDHDFSTYRFFPDDSRWCFVEDFDNTTAARCEVESDLDGDEAFVVLTYEDEAFIEKFRGQTIYSYLNTYIYPHVQSKVTLNKPIQTIDYTSCNRIVVTAVDGDTYTVDKVILATSAAVLKDGEIEFVPALPSEYSRALKAINPTPALRAWIEFSERFYEDATEVNIESDDRRFVFFDALAEDPSIGRNVLTFQTLDDEELVALDDGTVLDQMMAALDLAYDGKATETYVRHRIQNWSREPYIKGGIDVYGDEEDLSEVFEEPIQGRIFFCGEYAGEPVFGGRDAAEMILDNPTVGCSSAGRSGAWTSKVLLVCWSLLPFLALVAQ